MANFSDLQDAWRETDLALDRANAQGWGFAIQAIALAIREASIRLEIALRENRNSGIGDKRFG